eukprot:Phypoly_transcript_07959.p1 GENE.Phypoly_transcript_07959~~Phypoly_transcript_07959.p1  ORF type:complete len:198 (+),score=10.60 Phypoly_transcript_07959:17-610(+)
MSVHELPLHMISNVISKIPIAFVVNVSSISKRMHETLNMQHIWADLFKKDFCVNESEVQEKYKELNDWKLLYKHFYLAPLVIRLGISTTNLKLGSSVHIDVTIQNISKYEVKLQHSQCCYITNVGKDQHLAPVSSGNSYLSISFWADNILGGSSIANNCRWQVRQLKRDCYGLVTLYSTGLFSVNLSPEHVTILRLL